MDLLSRVNYFINNNNFGVAMCHCKYSLFFMSLFFCVSSLRGAYKPGRLGILDDKDRTKFIGLDFTRADLRNKDLSSREFYHVDFGNSNLTGASFEGSTLVGCRFFCSILRNVNFKNCVFEGCVFIDAVVEEFKDDDNIVLDEATTESLLYAKIETSGGRTKSFYRSFSGYGNYAH